MTGTTGTDRARARPARRGKRRDGAWHEPFLAAFERSSSVVQACKESGVSRSTVYRERQRDEAFAVRLADAEEVVTDGLERAAISRALEGSDRLLEFLLKARKPEVYAFAERMRHDHELVVKTELVTDEGFAADARDLLRRAAASSAG